MVTSHPDSIAPMESRPRFLYICGCDGTGKTTQARLLLAHLETRGIRPRHLWLRFPFLFSLPLLAYARWRGFSWYEETNGMRHGYWDFRRSWVLRRLFPWILLLDAAMAALIKIYVPLWLGQTIVCERFVIDMLVDAAVACGETGLHCRLPGRLYLRLLPARARITALDLDAATIHRRRADLRTDRRLEARLQAYRRLAADLTLDMIASERPIAELSLDICEMMESTNES